ncbi:ABC transporter ATP-binding protein [Sulfuricurvum sp.]|uniref:cell division ATP-binding protein FtsE n=1 Tax=Sulfuricurvum sp. TaxID=2025608 RepID=UPI001994E6DB|nr:ABC transporter ATP-binding protein [Sulfuricurvum sp.]MBD3799085.1 ABC transporter ATP-binding protein [Campylobacterota bacterium]MBD3806491.1 ABC transporter ATP-binding protein [Sulfuricurvum sp.]
MDKVIIAENLSLSYKEFETIISKATFSIDAGSFVFITGASGSGKSTLIKSFYGAIEPRAGQLMVGGVKINRISTSKLNFLRRHIGIVFQDYKLIKEWTIEKNVMLPLIISGYTKEVSGAQVQRLLSHVKLIHQAGKYPPELSGGEQQRVAVARALAHNPILILADEPTGNLDEYSSQVIWNLLEGANTKLKTTVVVVTHNIPSTITVAYKHYHIEMGNIYEIA